ncbi:MAG: HPF/RaiA family ribosome-associated protein [Bdellovibrionales bacterium]|nr:HPF/RaiA family ribosome-associated protein [Bdellovibrionales bacterium]
MEIEFQFNGFKNTKTLETYVVKRFQTLKRRIDTRFHDSNVLLRGSIVAKNSEGHAESFLAELSVKVPRSRTPYMVKKTETDFRTAVSEAVHAMETLLRRDSEKRERSRKTVGKSMKLVSKVKHGQAKL